MQKRAISYADASEEDMNSTKDDTMTNQTEALAPCPFCGNDKPSFERFGSARQSCIVICGNCGCRHESSDEGTRSGSSWNDRAALSSQPTAPRDAAYEECAKLCEEIARRKGEKFFGQIVSDGSAAQCARAIRAAAVQTDDAAALELEHFGDPQKGTGIYASLTGTAQEKK